MLLLLFYCWPLGHQVALLFGNWQLAMGIEDGGDDDDDDNDDDDDDNDDDDGDSVCLCYLHLCSYRRYCLILRGHNNFCYHLKADSILDTGDEIGFIRRISMYI